MRGKNDDDSSRNVCSFLSLSPFCRCPAGTSFGYTPCRFRDLASFFGGLPLRPTFLIGRTEESRSPGEVDVVEDATDEAEDEGSEEGDVMCIGWRR